jgi:hypothetical protein
MSKYCIVCGMEEGVAEEHDVSFTTDMRGVSICGECFHCPGSYQTLNRLATALYKDKKYKIVTGGG